MTKIRSPYYSAMGPHCIHDILEANGLFIDGLRFKGGSASLMPKNCLKEIVDLVHQHGIYIGIGNWVENLLMKGPRSSYVCLIRSEGLKARPQFDVRIEDASSLKDVQK
ncbi:hypothetical protein L7F22_013397 [Adiantum nelumboides]|nr:hypothetical protein [Adiantum nelumboides]